MALLYVNKIHSRRHRNKGPKQYGDQVEEEKGISLLSRHFLMGGKREGGVPRHLELRISIFFSMVKLKQSLSYLIFPISTSALYKEYLTFAMALLFYQNSAPIVSQQSYSSCQ